MWLTHCPYFHLITLLLLGPSITSMANSEEPGEMPHYQD